MKFRWRTLGGLVFVAALGIAAAVVFQRRATPESPASPVVADGSSFGSPSRGRIVPLVVAEDAPPPAFVPAQRVTAGDLDSWRGNQVLSLPTIRASAAGESVASPELSPAFPRPLELAPLASSESAHEIDDVRGDAPPSPVRHRIVDGDTLAALAERYLGDPSLAAEIYEQNRAKLPSPSVLPIGVELLIGGQQ